jgi:hypothetical protein
MSENVYTNQLAELTEMEFDAIAGLDIYSTYYIHNFRKSFTNINHSEVYQDRGLFFADGVDPSWSVEMAEVLPEKMNTCNIYFYKEY